MSKFLSFVIFLNLGVAFAGKQDVLRAVHSRLEHGINMDKCRVQTHLLQAKDGSETLELNWIYEDGETFYEYKQKFRVATWQWTKVFQIKDWLTRKVEAIVFETIDTRSAPAFKYRVSLHLDDEQIVSSEFSQYLGSQSNQTGFLYCRSSLP